MIRRLIESAGEQHPGTAVQVDTVKNSVESSYVFSA
jgi:hypothetical protein